jgi:hypothetical protein
MEEKNKKIIYAVVGGVTLGLLFILYKRATAKSTGTTLLKTDIAPNQPQTTTPTTPTTPIQEEINNQAPDIADMPWTATKGKVDTWRASQPSVDLKGLVQAPDMANLSNLLFDAFDGAGTTWKDGQFGGVYGVFSQLKSDNDFDSLNEFYGIRKVNAGIFRKDYTGDMNSTMNYDLSKREIRLINELLEKNGLTRRIIINA